MLTHRQVLAVLSNHLGAEALAHRLPGLLRAPLLWRSLHHREVLERVLATPPTHLDRTGAFLFVAGGLPRPDQAPEPLPGDLRDLLRDLGAAVTRERAPAATVERAAALALWLLRSPEVSLGRTDLEEPWLSALVGALAFHPDPPSLLRRVCPTPDCLTALRLANALLADTDPQQAASHWVAAFGPPDLESLDALWRSDLTTFAASLAKMAQEATDEGEPHTARALAAIYTGEPDEAQVALEACWQAACERLAEVADGLARVARLEGDPVSEHEALRRALEHAPTAERRARLALRLAQSDRAEEAIRLLPEAGGVPEAAIARAFALAVLRQRAEAVRYVDEIAGQDLSPEWSEALLDALDHLGEGGRALEEALRRLEKTPASAVRRADVARRLLEAGDPQAAVEEAALALALDERQETLALLAAALTAAGKPEEALPYWQRLAASPEHLPALFEAALQADRPEVARQALAALEARPEARSQAALCRARLEAHAGNLEAALGLSNGLLEQHPGLEEAWLLRADLLRSAGQSEARLTCLQTAAQALPGSAKTRLALAGALAEEGRAVEAAEAAAEAAHLAPEDPQVLLEAGEHLLKVKDYGRAAKLLEDALRLQPRNWRARTALARLYEGEGNPATALALLHPVPEEPGPEDLALLARLEVQAAELGREPVSERAIARLRQAMETGLDPALGSHWLARGHETRGESRQALEAYQKALGGGVPADLFQRTVVGLAGAALACGETSVALSALEQAREREPLTPDLAWMLAEAYVKAGLGEQALTTGEEAVAQEPENPAAWRRLAAIAQAAGQDSTAREALDRCLSLAPDDDEAWLALASLEAAQEPPAVRQALARALWFGREHVEVLRGVARLAADQGEHHTARRVLQRALRLQPKDPALLRQFASACQVCGDPATAAATWEKVVAQEPEAEAAAAAAQAHWQAGQRAKAVGWWQRALQMQPDNARLRFQLASALLENGEAEAALREIVAAVESAGGDEQALTTALLTLLDHGLGEEAFALAERLADADDGSAATFLKAVAHYEAGNLETASAHLQALEPTPEIAARWHALQAMLLELAGDHRRAQVAWQAAQQAEVRGDLDLGWLVRAALALGDWPATARYATVALQGGPIARLETARARLALASRWLFLEHLGVGLHLPAQENPTAEALEAVTAAVAEARALGTCPGLCSALEEQATLLKAYLADAAPGPKEGSGEAGAVVALTQGRPELTLRALINLRPPVRPEDRRWHALLVASAHLALERPQQALEALQAESPGAHLAPLHAALRGRSLATLGRVETAIEAYNQALAAWPEAPGWHAALGRLYLEAGQPDAALAHLQAALEFSEDEPEVLASLAQTLRLLGQPSEALTYYERAVQKEPDNPTLWQEMAETLLAAGDASAAARTFQVVLERAPERLQALLGLARAQLMLGDQAAAQKAVTALLSRVGEDPDLLLEAAEVLGRIGQVEEALDLYRRVEAIDDHREAARAGRARLLLEAGRPREAAKALVQGQGGLPKDPQALALLARALEAADDLQAAARVASAAVETSPASSQMRVLLGRLARRRGQLDQALDELAQAIELNPTNAEAYLEMGLVYEARRQPSQALEVLRRALNLAPQSLEAHLHLGRVLKQLKAYPEAAAVLKRAVEIHPTNAEAMHQLAAVRALELVHGGIQTSGMWR